MQPIATIELPAKLESLHAFIEFASSFASGHGFTSNDLNNIDLCLEEALVNIFSYAYGNQTGLAQVECRFEDKKLTIKVVDSGSPFNMLAVKSPDIYEKLATNRIGGFGLILIKKLTDNVQYERRDDKNILTLTFLPRTGRQMH